MPSPPPPSPPYLSIILPQSSPTATVTPPITCPLCMSARLVFIFVFFNGAYCRALFCECAMLTSGLHVAQGIFCCVRVLMEIMRLPTRAWRWTKDCLLWVTYWACANAIWPHEINGKTLPWRQTRGRASLILGLLILHVFVLDGGFFKMMHDFILIMSALYGVAHFYWNVAIKLGRCKIFVSLYIDRGHLHFSPKYFNRRA